MFITLQQYTVLAFDVNWCTSWSIIKRNYRYVYVYETHKNITINSGKRSFDNKWFWWSLHVSGRQSLTVQSKLCKCIVSVTILGLSHHVFDYPENNKIIKKCTGHKLCIFLCNFCVKLWQIFRKVHLSVCKMRIGLHLKWLILLSSF